MGTKSADPLIVRSRAGFNGELFEPGSGHYLLGLGYRAYNPRLMRFNSPDSLSPFQRGGLNAYAYCLGDPVNLLDPSGHVPGFLKKFFGFKKSTASAKDKTTSVTDNNDFVKHTTETFAGKEVNVVYVSQYDWETRDLYRYASESSELNKWPSNRTIDSILSAEVALQVEPTPTWDRLASLSASAKLAEPPKLGDLLPKPSSKRYVYMDAQNGRMIRKNAASRTASPVTRT